MVNWDFKDNSGIDDLIKLFIEENDYGECSNGNLVIGIDGMCGSGKTSLADYIANKYEASVIHMDDFFLPPELRTEERLSMPGGNVHYERFIEEVGRFIGIRGSGISYRRFNCSLMDYDSEKIKIKPSKIFIVEGSYSMRPELCGYYDMKIFMKCEKKIQESRIIARNGKAKYEMFRTKWIPMEEKYFSELNVEGKADYIIFT